MKAKSTSFLTDDDWHFYWASTTTCRNLFAVDSGSEQKKLGFSTSKVGFESLVFSYRISNEWLSNHKSLFQSLRTYQERSNGKESEEI